VLVASPYRKDYLTRGWFVADLARRRVRATPISTNAIPASTVTVMVSPRTKTRRTIGTTGSR
jgi:hypothetical protein